MPKMSSPLFFRSFAPALLFFLLFSLSSLSSFMALKAQQSPPIPNLNPNSKPNPNALAAFNPNDFRVTLRPLKESFSLDEPVVMEVRLVNRSPANRSFRFLLFDSPYAQFTFQLVTQAGNSSLKTITYLSYEAEQSSTPAPPAQLNKPPQPAEGVREIELAPGQAFSWKVTVDDFFELTESGRYFIQGAFFPLSRSVADYSLPFEASSFYRELPTPLRSEASTEASSVTALTATKQSLEQRLGTVRELSPEGTVRSLLNYRKSQDWPAFLSQFHLESLLSATFRSTEYFERYQAALPQEKPIVMEEFRAFLVESQLSPGYLILEQLLYDTQIHQAEAQSAVLLKIRFPVEMQEKKFNPLTLQEDSFWKPDFTTFLEGYRIFTYSLSRLKGVWKIMHYDVRVVTEREALFIKERLSPAFASKPLPAASPVQTETVEQTAAAPNSSVVPFDFFPVVFFPFDQAQPLPGQEETLQTVALFLLNNASLRVRLLGYTDDSGRRDYNITLSRNRAQAIKTYLMAAGIEAGRISIYGLGEESSPSETSLGEGDGETVSEAQRQKQRRVEVYFFSADAN